MTETTDTAPMETKVGGDSSSSSAALSLGFDASEFMHFLDETDWSDEEKAEYITLVWGIVCDFVAMGFGVHPVQQAQKTCGQPSETGAKTAFADPGVVDSSHGQLIEKFVRLSGMEADSGEEGVDDG